jgi:hypothetical protein
MFDLSKVDWLKAHEFAINTLVKKACNIWNEWIENTKEISLMLKLNRCTVIKYLKQGEKLGWCNYDSEKVMLKSGKKQGKNLSKSTVQLTLDMQFIKEWDSQSDAFRALNLSKNGLTLTLKGKNKHAGGYKWMYKEDYDQYIKQTQINS